MLEESRGKKGKNERVRKEVGAKSERRQGKGGQGGGIMDKADLESEGRKLEAKQDGELEREVKREVSKK